MGQARTFQGYWREFAERPKVRAPCALSHHDTDSDLVALIQNKARRTLAGWASAARDHADGQPLTPHLSPAMVAHPDVCQSSPCTSKNTRRDETWRQQQQQQKCVPLHSRTRRARACLRLLRGLTVAQRTGRRRCGSGHTRTVRFRTRSVRGASDSDSVSFLGTFE